MVPGGGEIFPTLAQLQEIALEHTEEAEKIAKDPLEEIQDVLQMRARGSRAVGAEGEEECEFRSSRDSRCSICVIHFYTVADHLRDELIMTPALTIHNRRRLVRRIFTIHAAQSDSLSYYSSYTREPGLLLTK